MKHENGQEDYKFLQTLLSSATHKDLRRFAVEQDMTLAEAAQEIIKSYFDKEK